MNKPLDSMNLNAKEALNSSSVRPHRIMKISKRIKKKIENSKFEIRSAYLFPHFRFGSLRFDSVQFNSFSI